MAATRRPPLVDVHQESDASYHGTLQADVETALLNALAPLTDASNKYNVQLVPPTSSDPTSSPTKTDSSPPRPMTSHHLQNYPLPPPSQLNFSTDSPQKKIQPHASYAPAQVPAPPIADQSLFSRFAAAPNLNKENYDTAVFASMPIMPYADDGYGYKAPMKRTSADAAPLNDRPGVKKVKMEEEPFELPDPKDMPAVYDNGQKPNISYAELIGMAILRSPQRRLTLAQIYKWISDNFAFYRTAESGWQNSIRHNLSLNKNFIKQERPKDDPGKGNYWAIKPGEERPFLMGKKNPVRRLTGGDSGRFMHGLEHDLANFRPGTGPAIGQFSLAPNPTRKTDTKHIDSAKFPDDADLSSDATVAASDGVREDDRDDSFAMPPPSQPFRSSPPPHDIASSPPAMPNQSQREDTPPPAPRLPSNSRSGGRRRKFSALNDSGYWSSIESSAARGAAHLLTSEADVGRSRLRKGRAEAEIARIRSSSFDSPIKDKQSHHALDSHYESSSPVKEDSLLTPAVIFKRPERPPPSVSPNTNLRNHRNRMRALLGSPAKVLSPLPETTSWSPAFTLVEDGEVNLTPYRTPFVPVKTPWKPLNESPSANGNSLFKTAFDIFIDAPEEDLTARGSPEKRSMRRPSLARAVTSTSILADITGTAKSNNMALAPPRNSPFSLSPFPAKPSALRSPAKIGSPLKQSFKPPTSNPLNNDLIWHDVGIGTENAQPPTVLNANDAAADLFGAQLPSDGSEEGIDIFQDFGKIGQTHAPVSDRANGSPVKRTAMGPPARPAARAGLSRSNTSRW